MIALHVYIYLRLFKLFFVKSYSLNNYFLNPTPQLGILVKKLKKTVLNEGRS